MPRESRAAGIRTATLLRWQELPEFQVALREARRAAHNQSTARLRQATGAAVTTLLKVMVDPATPASTKVPAADSILNRSGQRIELEDIEARVAELERAAELRNREDGCEGDRAPPDPVRAPVCASGRRAVPTPAGAAAQGACATGIDGAPES
jgi:hypothetical protein